MVNTVYPAIYMRQRSIAWAILIEKHILLPHSTVSSLCYLLLVAELGSDICEPIVLERISPWSDSAPIPTFTTLSWAVNQNGWNSLGPNSAAEFVLESITVPSTYTIFNCFTMCQRSSNQTKHVMYRRLNNQQTDRKRCIYVPVNITVSTLY